MERRTINPWTWQEQFGYQQGNEVTGATRTLWISGQTSIDADGNPLHEEDMEAQIRQVVTNIEAVLAKADMTPANLVALKFMTTDVDSFAEHAHELSRLNEAGAEYTSTVIQVVRLAFPQFLVEIEATAVA